MITTAYCAERASSEGARPLKATPRPMPNDALVINPEFVVAREGYHVRFASGIAQLRNKVSLLVERMYSWRGLHTDHPVMQDDRAGQTTLVACSGDHLFGTVTVGIDTGEGLLADTLYGPQIDAVREQGGRVCELTRLAMDPSFNSPEVMGTVFHLAFMVARLVHGMTDLFVEVHPRHAGFYRRMLDCRIAGPERVCPRVGAPAVLLQLSLDHAETQIKRLGGKHLSDDRSLYRMFFSPTEEERLLHRLRAVPKAA